MACASPTQGCCVAWGQAAVDHADQPQDAAAGGVPALRAAGDDSARILRCVLAGVLQVDAVSWRVAFKSDL